MKNKFREISHKLRDNQQFYYWWFIVILMIPSCFLFFTEPMSISTRIAFLALPLSVYMGIMLVAKRPGIIIWCLFPLILLGALQLVLLYLFGNSIIAVDMYLNIVTTNSNEAMELLGKLSPAIAGVCIIYIPTLIFGVLSIKSHGRLSSKFRLRNLIRAGVLLVLGIIAVFVSKWQDPDFKIKLDIWPANIFYNVKIAVDKVKNDKAYPITSKDFSFEAVSEHPDSLREVYVMVVGETSRALNWGLYGYDRNTTPRLSATEHLIHLSDLLTQANATHKSVPMMLSAASAEDFDTIYHQKSIITAFKEAGFHTVFISNQRPNGSFIDHFSQEADKCIFLKKNKPAEYNPHDKEILSLLKEELSSNYTKTFVVIHTYGSHFNYAGRYGDGDRRFTPDKINAVKKSDRTALINSYDNSIVATDHFLSDIIYQLQYLNNTASAMIYASDHGEDIFDDRRGLFLHASPRPTYYQLHIPGLIWLSSTYDSLYPNAVDIAKTNSRKPMTSNVLFHTVLDIGGINTPWKQDSLSVISPSFKVSTRYYLTDHCEPCAIDSLGLNNLDIEMFAKQGIVYNSKELDKLNELP